MSEPLNTLDQDLQNLDLENALKEVVRLREGIRKHRDEHGDDRCWLDDERLYGLLPDNVKAVTGLPDRKTFLSSCERFYDSRQSQCPKKHEW